MSHYNSIDLNVRQVKRNRRTAGRCRPQARRSRPCLEALEQRVQPTITVFQQGVAGYTSTHDTQISAGMADTTGNLATVSVAGPGATGGQVEGLIRFDNLFGTAANQIPIGAKINAASLTVEVPTASNFPVTLSRMLVDFTETSTWNQLGGGIQANNVKSLFAADSSLDPAQGLGPRAFNVTSSVQAWAYNASNKGWAVVMSSGNTTWQFASSETTASRTPILAVDWTAPSAAAGTFGFSAASYRVNQNIGSATITVNRTDGSLGAVSVSYATSNGIATAGQDYTAASGTLNFAANEFSKTFTVPITKQALLGNPDKTVNLNLSNPTGGAVLGTPAGAVLTIVDQTDSVQFSAATTTVAENVGNATITVSRTGLGGGAASVQYTTVRGSATPGQDFTAVSGTLNWVDGDASPKTITVAITDDTLYEATEKFYVDLSNATGAAVLGSATRATVSITDNDPAPAPVTVTFQQGAASYTGVQHVELREDMPGTHLLENATGLLRTDGVDGSQNLQAQVLLRFDNIFGTGTGQIPLGSTITKATLTVQEDADTSTNFLDFHRLLQNYDINTVSWGTFGTDGVTLDDKEAVKTPDGTFAAPPGNTALVIDVTPGVQAWSGGATNLGWNGRMRFDANGQPIDDGINFSSNADSTVSNRPKLSVSYVPPTPGYLTFSAANYSVNEAGGNLTVTVARQNGTGGTVTVGYATSDGTATAGKDYTATSGTLTFAPGETSKTFTVPITDDKVPDPNETFKLALNNPTGPTGVSLGDIPDAVVTIVDNHSPGQIQFSAATYTVAENVGNATITVSRAIGNTGAVSVQYTTVRGSATPGQDYTTASGTLNWADGDLANKTFTVAITDDTLPEATEKLYLVLSNATGGAALGSLSTATLAITDNDPPATVTVTFQQGAASYTGVQHVELREDMPGTHLLENATGLLRTDGVDGSQNLQAQVLLRYDNLFGTGANQIPLGSTITKATVTLQEDADASTNFLDFHRILQNYDINTVSWGTFGTDGVTLDDKEAVKTPDGTFAAPPGNASLVIDVTPGVQAWSGGAPNLGWNARMRFDANGQPIDDGINFSSNADGTVSNRPKLSVSYVAPMPGYLTFSAASYSVNESAGTLTVTVVRQNGSAGAVAVNYSTSDGTAKAGTNYTTTSGTLSFAPGETSKTITIPLLDDKVVTGGLTFNLALNNPTGPTGVSLGDIPDAVVTIADNDGPGTLQFSAPTYSVGEGGGSVVVTVSRTGGIGAAGNVTVAYATSDGTATAGKDYTTASGTLTFAPGDTSKTITIAILEDTIPETDETLTVTLSNPSGGATLGNQSSAAVTIADNDPHLLIQQGLNGYTGTEDTDLRADTPGVNQGTATTVTSSLVVTNLQGQALLRFNNLFGTAANQIPANVNIQSAKLTLTVTDGSVGAISVNRMLASWSQASSTWNTLDNGVQFVTEASLIPDSPATVVSGIGPRSFDVTSSLRAWQANPATNLGWLFFNNSSDAWSFASSEATTANTRPLLEVVFNTEPLPPGGAPVDVTNPVDVSSTGVNAALPYHASRGTISVLPAQPGLDRNSAAVAVLLGASDHGTRWALGDNREEGLAAQARDVLFQAYANEVNGKADAALSSGRGLIDGRTGDSAPDGLADGDSFDVNGLFGNL